MRDAREWRDAIYPTISLAEIRAIQSDAARSERERAARVCDDLVAAARFLDESSGLAELCRNRIRALPDALGAEGEWNPESDRAIDPA